MREVSVEGFSIDRHPVTVSEFRRFVQATGHVTWAERPPDPADYPDADPELLVPGSLVFRKAAGPVDVRDYRNWWESDLLGTDWRGFSTCPPVSVCGTVKCHLCLETFPGSVAS